MQRLFRRAILHSILLGCSLSAQAAQFTIGELMATLANRHDGVATFTETKYLAILDLPVESSGELLFAPPARLEKRTLKPKVETLALDGEVLTVVSQTQRHVLQLKDYPEVAGIVESLRAILTGDRQALERLYRLKLEGSPQRWALELKPLDAAVGWSIARIRVEGTGDEVRSVEIQQTDGDRSVMRVQKGVSP
ncbi:LolA-related protein [uncultured Thiodictyon sp.]|uniref:LolA-related protein n=1 Tax=uncultured Thiodictyon sp. TaxID=1846217 RepID=UPI0025E27827|nr:LolA-related protein [uncultured Thiodictyon sp.]